MDFPPMRLNNIIAQTQSQSRALSSGLSGEERLEDFVFDGLGDTGAVVFDRDLYFVTEVFGGDGDCWR